MLQSEIRIAPVTVKSVMTKSNAPLGGYAVNPYVGCPHACKYCYASFMKRFTGHTEEWGAFLDVKYWPKVSDPSKYAGQKVIIGTVTDGYNPLEETYKRTRKILEELKDSGADILICTKSDLVLRDMDLLKEIGRNGRLTVSWSVNTLDEDFKNDMDEAVSIERRLDAMKKVYDSGIRTVCFISPVFPGITDIEAIFDRAKDRCDLIWLENLNLRGGFKKTVMDYIRDKHPELIPLYDEIYNRKDRSYFEALERKAEEIAKKHGCRFVDNETPYERVPKGHPTIVDYFYHEEVRGTENSGKRNR
ncbi:MAG: radical SAM mobile pair protein B [Lachnospiraceae bacterium]|nr:radical SAM mobile pair protein B [Lachnospiraceae bacterium]